jgi:hypothetical protein
MNKKILMMTMTLLTVSIMVTPLIGTVQACRQRGSFITKTLTGIYWVFPEANPPSDPWGPYATEYEKDGISIVIWKKLPQVWEGNIVGSATYSGIWSVITWPTDIEDYGIVVIKDAVVDGIGTGDLVIYVSRPYMKILWGTGDLRGIKGTGEVSTFGAIKFGYSLDVRIRQ